MAWLSRNRSPLLTSKVSARSALPPPIPAATQFGAIALLRWRLFQNAFRRKSEKGDLAARIIGLPFVGFILLGVISAAFSSAYSAATSGNLLTLQAVFWGIFLLQIVTSFNIASPGLAFDPESLIRFPLSFPRYLLIRLFLGLLSASTVLGTLALVAAAAGISAADQSLAPAAFAAAIALALTQTLFTRMIFAWVDRWLSTRRAREFLTFFVIAFSIAVQWANVTINNLGGRDTEAQQAAKLGAVLQLYHRLDPLLRALPPGLAASALLQTSHGLIVRASFTLFAVLGYAALFLAVFAWRMQREYRGENLSEVPHAPKTAEEAQIHARSSTLVPSVSRAAPPISKISTGSPLRPSPIFTACFHKEWINIRRNPAQFYGLLAPLAMVFLFAGRLGQFAKMGLVFPAAAAYSILGVAALAYNVFGLDGSGVQLYFLGPIRIRTVFLAKNLFGLGITALQVVLLYLVLVFTSGRPPTLVAVSTLLWVVFAALINITVGNLRSLSAPKRIDPAKISRKQASQLSALLALALMLGAAAVGAGLLLLARSLAITWLPIPIFILLDAAALAIYLRTLQSIDTTALKHRETLIQELSKAQ